MAPFAGLIMLGNNSNEVFIQTEEGPMRDTTIILTNLQPNDTIFHPLDGLYIQRRVNLS